MSTLAENVYEIWLSKVKYNQLLFFIYETIVAALWLNVFGLWTKKILVRVLC